jgi:hypothetical protein
MMGRPGQRGIHIFRPAFAVEISEPCSPWVRCGGQPQGGTAPRRRHFREIANEPHRE